MTNFHAHGHDYKVVVTKHSGAPILLIHGLGGLDAATLEWGLQLEKKGWQVYMPMIDCDFGNCNVSDHLSRLQKHKILVTDQVDFSGPVVPEMGLLADWISRQHGNRRVVVVGTCLTGGFPLALLGRVSVKAAVLCQPALPLKSLGQVVFRLPQSAEEKVALGLSPAQVDSACRALRSDPTKRLYGFHYYDDPLAYFDKFAWLHDKLSQQGLGAKFRPVVLVPTGSRQNAPWWYRMESSVPESLTEPHITLTGSAEADRARLRARFDQLVRP